MITLGTLFLLDIFLQDGEKARLVEVKCNCLSMNPVSITETG